MIRYAPLNSQPGTQNVFTFVRDILLFASRAAREIFATLMGRNDVVVGVSEIPTPQQAESPAGSTQTFTQQLIKEMLATAQAIVDNAGASNNQLLNILKNKGTHQ
jgi:hypothetical protein